MGRRAEMDPEVMIKLNEMESIISGDEDWGLEEECRRQIQLQLGSHR